jgi:hypothetical protein
MQALLKFMYKGSVEVLDADIQSFMYTANELKIRGLADDLLKETIKLVAERDGDPADDHQEKRDCVDVGNAGHGDGSGVNDVKITDVRTTDIIEDQQEECSNSIPCEQSEDAKKSADQSSEFQDRPSASSLKELGSSAVEKLSLEPIPVRIVLYI